MSDRPGPGSWHPEARLRDGRAQDPDYLAATKHMTCKERIAYCKEHNLRVDGFPYKNPDNPDKTFRPRPHPFTSEQAREYQKKGVKKRRENAMRRKLYRDMARAIIDARSTEKVAEKTRKMLGDSAPDVITNYDAALSKLVSKAVKGDVSALKMLVDMGEKIDAADKLDYGTTTDQLTEALKEIGRVIDEGREG